MESGMVALALIVLVTIGANTWLYFYLKRDRLKQKEQFDRLFAEQEEQIKKWKWRSRNTK